MKITTIRVKCFDDRKKCITKRATSVCKIIFGATKMQVNFSLHSLCNSLLNLNESACKIRVSYAPDNRSAHAILHETDFSLHYN